MCTVYGSLEVIPISPYPHASLSEEIIGLDNTIMYYFARNVDQSVNGRQY